MGIIINYYKDPYETTHYFHMESIQGTPPPSLKPPEISSRAEVLSMVLTLFGTTLYGLSNFSVTSWSLIMILLGHLDSLTGLTVKWLPEKMYKDYNEPFTKLRIPIEQPVFSWNISG